jgi:polysaccharide export outer membrane protein
MMLVRLGLCIGAFVSLCGCASGSELDRSSSAVHVATALPPPDSTVVPVAIAPYHVVPGDELTVSIFGAPELGSTGLVDGAGNFSMPLAGTFHVAGMTPEQVSASIEDKLRGPYLKNPHVALNVKQSGNQQSVTVDGEVQQPGIYPVLGRMTLQQAIATAHGASDTANIRNVVVFRTVNNQKMAALFDLKSIRAGRAPDPEVYGNDIVVVGQSAIQKFLRSTTMAFPILGRFIPFVL